MKKLLSIIPIAVLLVGCSDGTPTYRQQLVNYYKTDKIIGLPKSSESAGYFLVKDNNGAIWYVDVWNDTNRTTHTLLFSGDTLPEKK